MAEYLAIDGWAEFQSLRGRGAWIKDATDQDDRPKLSGLSMFVRGVLQELRRVRGRTGKNIPYDLDHIARATHTIGTDRPHLHHALSTLISRGVLIVTTESLDESKKPEKEIEKEKEKEIDKTPSPRCASADEVFAKAYRAYPRHVGKRAAEKAWKLALGRRKAEHTLGDAQEFIYQRVMQFGAICNKIHKPRQYIPHMATWLNGSRFLDDPSEWAVVGENGHGKQSKQLAEQESKAGTSRAIAAAMGKVFGRADAVGSEHVPAAVAAKPGNAG